MFIFLISGMNLRRQLETGLQYQAANTQDVGQITEEFTQRLSALERRFQQAIRDKEELKKQLDVSDAVVRGQGCCSRAQLFVLLAERQTRGLVQSGSLRAASHCC
jgi:hypothetical protein